jgi:hypothetical protein
MDTGKQDSMSDSNNAKKEDTMNKIMRVGTIDVNRGKVANIYIKAQYKGGKLSISGVVGPLPSGNALGGAGQIEMEFAHRNPSDDDKRYGNDLLRASDIRYAVGWDAEKWLDLLDIWKEWHLNDLKAGCEHQREMGWEKEGYDKHPSEPCPVCGYEFGSAWNRVEVPEAVIQFIESLPDTDTIPAWI